MDLMTVSVKASMFTLLLLLLFVKTAKQLAFLFSVQMSMPVVFLDLCELTFFCG